MQTPLEQFTFETIHIHSFCPSLGHRLHRTKSRALVMPFSRVSYVRVYLCTYSCKLFCPPA